MVADRRTPKKTLHFFAKRLQPWRVENRETSMFGLRRVFFALCAILQNAALGHPPPQKIPIAEGIVLFVTAPYGEVGLDGNSVAILSRDGVLVFDSNGTPAAAEAVLVEIRKMTDQPVRYLVNSHWHWDHWY